MISIPIIKPYDFEPVDWWAEWRELMDNSPESVVDSIRRNLPDDVVLIIGSGESRLIDLRTDGLDHQTPKEIPSD